MTKKRAKTKPATETCTKPKKTKTATDWEKHEEHRLIAWKREREIQAELRKSIDHILDEASTDSLIEVNRMIAEVVKYDEGYETGFNSCRAEQRRCQAVTPS